MCGAEGERLMSAFVDTDITNYNQPTHLTMNGCASSPTPSSPRTNSDRGTTDKRRIDETRKHPDMKKTLAALRWRLPYCPPSPRLPRPPPHPVQDRPLIPASPSGSVAAPVEDSDGGGILLLGDSVFANPDFLGAPNIDAARAGDLDNVTCGRGSDRVANRLAELVDVPSTTIPAPEPRPSTACVPPLACRWTAPSGRVP